MGVMQVTERPLLRHNWFDRPLPDGMPVKGLNDSETGLEEIKHAGEMTNPDRAYVPAPIHPPAEARLRQADPKDISRAEEVIGETVSVTELEGSQFSLGEFHSARQARP